MPLATTINADILSISLTAGDWNVWGSVTIVPSLVPTLFIGGISSISTALPPSHSGAYMKKAQTFPSEQTQTAPVGMTRFSLAATTTIYLVLRADNLGTCSGNGFLSARRER